MNPMRDCLILNEWILRHKYKKVKRTQFSISSLNESAKSTIDGRNGMNILFWTSVHAKVIVDPAIQSWNSAMKLWLYQSDNLYSLKYVIIIIADLL